MPTEGRQPSIVRIFSSTVAIGLTLAGVFVSSCDRPTASDATTASASPTPRIEAAATGVVLRADPNPVLAGNPDGTTTVIWDTGSKDTAGDVYVVEAGKEKLFSTGAQGSQEASWIKPGSTEFRLYSQTDRKLLAQLTVTMSTPPAAPVTSASATPSSSVTP